MKYDSFLSQMKPRDPDAVVKSAPVEKVGWTDEAREAAAVARAHGYKKNPAQQHRNERVMTHPSGHVVAINTRGEWDHAPAPGSKPSSSTSRYGRSAQSLRTRLEDFHGKPDSGKNVPGRPTAPRFGVIGNPYS